MYLSVDIKSNCEDEHENIEEFLLSFGSTQIGLVIFKGNSILIHDENCNSEYENSLYFEVYPCSSYFYGLRDAISKATMYAWIDTILFSSKEFSSIFRAAKLVKQLHFVNCKILTDGECELEQMEGWQIEILSAGNYVYAYKHKRGYEDSCMKIFISILGCRNLLKSLRKIEFRCGRDMGKKLISKVEEILDSYYHMQMVIIEDQVM